MLLLNINQLKGAYYETKRKTRQEAKTQPYCKEE